MRLVSPEETIRLQKLALEWTELRDRHRERHPLWHSRLRVEKTERRRAKALARGGLAAQLRAAEVSSKLKEGALATASMTDGSVGM